MKFDTSVSDDDSKFADDETDADFFEPDQRDYRKKRTHSAEIRRRIEEKMEEKWLREELSDFDTY